MAHGLPKSFTAEGLTHGSEPTTGIKKRVQGEVPCNHQAVALGGNEPPSVTLCLKRVIKSLSGKKKN